MTELIRRLLAPLVCLFAAAALIAGCGDDDSSGLSGPSADADSDPQTVLDSALGSEGDPIESGVLDLSIEVAGGASSSASASLSGPFSSNGEEELPSVDFDVEGSADAEGTPLSFEGGLTLTPDGLFVGYGGEEYQLDESTFGILQQSYQQSSQLQEDQADGGGSLSQFGIDPANWLTDVTNEGVEDVDGTETVHISGVADVPRMVEDLGAVAEGTGQTLDSSGLEELRNSVKSASIDVYADASNSALRKLDLSLEITDPASGGTDSLTLSIGIAEPNAEQEIDAPDDAKPLTDLIGEVPGLAESLGGIAGPTAAPTAPSGSSGAPSLSPGATEKYYDCVAKAQTPEDVTDCQKVLE